MSVLVLVRAAGAIGRVNEFVGNLGWIESRRHRDTRKEVVTANERKLREQFGELPRSLATPLSETFADCLGEAKGGHHLRGLFGAFFLALGTPVRC